VAVLAQLRKYKLIVNGHFELAALRGDQRDAFDLGLELFQKLGR
jgi:hypothetical protein